MMDPSMALAAPDMDCFRPSDAQLIDQFLRFKIIAGRLHHPTTTYFFRDADVYSAAPSDLVAAHHASGPGDHGGRVWYFFSPVAGYAGASRTRKSRTVGGTDGKGHWHMEGKKRVQGTVGGYKYKFSYKMSMKTSSGTITKPGGWLMAEYSIDDDDYRGIVVAKIYPSPRQSEATNALLSSTASSAPSSSTAFTMSPQDVENLQMIDAANNAMPNSMESHQELMQYCYNFGHHDDTSQAMGQYHAGQQQHVLQMIDAANNAMPNPVESHQELTQYSHYNFGNGNHDDDSQAMGQYHAGQQQHDVVAAAAAASQGAGDYPALQQGLEEYYYFGNHDVTSQAMGQYPTGQHDVAAAGSQGADYYSVDAANAMSHPVESHQGLAQYFSNNDDAASQAMGQYPAGQYNVATAARHPVDAAAAGQGSGYYPVTSAAAAGQGAGHYSAADPGQGAGHPMDDISIYAVRGPVLPAVIHPRPPPAMSSQTAPHAAYASTSGGLPN